MIPGEKEKKKKKRIKRIAQKQLIDPKCWGRGVCGGTNAGKAQSGQGNIPPKSWPLPETFVVTVTVGSLRGEGGRKRLLFVMKTCQY